MYNRVQKFANTSLKLLGGDRRAPNGRLKVECRDRLDARLGEGCGGEAERGSIRHGTASTALRESVTFDLTTGEKSFFFRFLKMADDPKRVTLRRRISSLYLIESVRAGYVSVQLLVKWAFQR